MHRGDELRAFAVGLIALSLALPTSACGRRGCEDPRPVVDALRPPTQSTVLSKSEPPPLNGRCSQEHKIGYASNAPEKASLDDVSAQLVAQGFARVDRRTSRRGGATGEGASCSSSAASCSRG